MLPINRGHAEVSVPYKQQHRCHRQAQKNTELFTFGAGAIGTRVLHVRALIMARDWRESWRLIIQGGASGRPARNRHLKE
jgi:hypothetical protein